jgi:hypothetical protein
MAPQFDGTFTTATSTMNFSSSFQPKFGGDIDFTVKPSLIPPSNTVTGYVSSGELVPTRSTAFEPGADRQVSSEQRPSVARL